MPDRVEAEAVDARAGAQPDPAFAGQHDVLHQQSGLSVHGHDGLVSKRVPVWLPNGVALQQRSLRASGLRRRMPVGAKLQCGARQV
jgi:hypothetical protein